MMIKSFVTTSEFYAHPVYNLVRKAAEYTSECTIVYQAKQANLKSILGLLSLAIPKDAIINIRVEGEDEKQALDALEHLFKSKELAKNQ